MTADNWYNKPLNLNDKIAGGTLIFFAIIFLSICTITSFVLYRESHVIKSFLYLLSAAINNMFLLINYALLPGILILFKKHVPKYGRRFCQIYFDTMWFSMCYHTLLIAWTRFAAICRPCQFRKQQNSTIYMLCSMCYVIAVVQSTVVYFQPWYVTFYYEASAYGMIPEDIELYLKGGKSQFFTIFHSLIFIATFALYSCALFLLFKYNLQVRRSHVTKITPSAIRPNATRWSLFPTASVGIRTETKLILPCFCNAVVFLIGQVVITIGISENRWTLWLILVLFTFTASVDSLTLLIFSSTIRKGIMIMLRDLFCFRNKKTKVAMIKVSNTFSIIIN
ncbi:putative integral membrane protein [Acanthocheilonema viteae]